MAGPFDITGTWRGHYEQNGSRRAISMQVAQRGQSFVGRMRDHDTVLSGSFDLAVGDAPDGPAESLAFETMGVLPEFSIVEGTVEDDRVVFDKRYEGTHTITVWGEDGYETRCEIPQHEVRYAGRLDAVGRRLSGRWRIAGSEGDEHGEGAFDEEVGAFELFRQ